MAYNIKEYGGYGTGKLGAVTDPTGQLCSYANVTAYDATTVTIGVAAVGAYEKFEAGTEILLHVSGCTGGTTAEYLGKYLVCNITAVAGSVLTIDKDFTAIMPLSQLGVHVVQAITIPQFSTLTLTGVSVSPLAYSVGNKYGCILPLKCSTELVLSGGSIKLTDMGIPVASKALRYWTTQEDATYNATVTTTTSANGLLDADKYAGWENHITSRQLLLNAGDGAAFVMAKKITNAGSSTTTRIGGTTAGAYYCRGASDSAGLTASTTNIGGSTILLACDDIDGFMPSMISKVRSTASLGQGLGRCYIACKNTKLKSDEGLYAHDVISDPQRIMKQCNIKNYGTGRHGAISATPTGPLNNYATVKDIDSTGKIITYANLTTDGMSPFNAGSTVMLHVSKPIAEDFTYLGRYMLAKIVAHDSTNKQIIIDTSATMVIPIASLSRYNVQIVSVYEPTTLVMASQYTLTTAWNDTNKNGGICAIAAKTSIDITGGGIIVTGKGGSGAFTENDAYTYFGQTQCSDVLPLGNSGGAVFLLTPLLKGDSTSRLGNTWDGAGVSRYSATDGANSGGTGGKCKRVNALLGVSVVIISSKTIGLNIHMISVGGASGEDGVGLHGGLAGGANNGGGSGYAGSGGTGYNSSGGIGGYGLYAAGGGGGGTGNYGAVGGGDAGANGGGGYGLGTASACSGGGGGYPSGYAFIYCNTVENEDTTGVVI